MNYTQQQWFDNATEQERKAYVIKGEPHSKQMFPIIDGKLSLDNSYYVAMLRDVRIDDEKYKSAEEAHRAAQHYKLSLLKEQNLPELNESELGISDFNKNIVDEDNLLSVESIIHLAAQFNKPCSALQDFLELELEDIKKTFEGSVKPKALLNADYDLFDDWTDWMIDHELYGWLIQVMMPKIKYIKQDSYTYTWSIIHPKWIYAETYELAYAKAKAWQQEELKKLNNNNNI